jgi:hypothetical protein
MEFSWRPPVPRWGVAAKQQLSLFGPSDANAGRNRDNDADALPRPLRRLA